ncbi:MAG: phosphoglucosamine mutase [Deltaproteobacteria bacterium]|nr:phosphoglucosamine mutase [Deltaproteobacteria bacterium]
MKLKLAQQGKKRRLFGTDGIRGIANQYPMDGATALRVGQAIGAVLREMPGLDQVVVGKDTRLSGYVIETALTSGICSMGMNVMLVGPLPTPGIAFIANSMRAKGGAMVSASHNPIEYNGIKLFDSAGFKLSDDVELRVEELLFGKELDDMRVPPHLMGKAYRIDDASGRYIQYLKGTFPSELTLEGLKIVIDCANGAGYRVAPMMLRELGAEVISTCVSPNGININKDCGALHPHRMARMVRENKADLGIALDGDADRVIMCDEYGNLVDGDAILAICATHLHERGLLSKATVVGTNMTNLALELLLKERGIKLIRTDVGDRYVMEVMRREGYTLGGETCGHIIFLQHTTCGDGILAALRVLAVMCQERQSLADVAGLFVPFPQLIKNIHVRTRMPFDEIPGFNREIKDLEKELGGKGRYLVRYSGTENIARVMIEAEDEQKVEILVDRLASFIEDKIGMKETPPGEVIEAFPHYPG